MPTAERERTLGERLGRLTGAEAEECVPGYRAIGRKLARSKEFPRTLRRVKALADEHRLLAVLLLRRRGELCACEVQAATGLTHATVSHHMAVLTDAGLVRARRHGKWTYYRLDPAVALPLP